MGQHSLNVLGNFNTIPVILLNVPNTTGEIQMDTLDFLPGCFAMTAQFSDGLVKISGHQEHSVFIFQIQQSIAEFQIKRIKDLNLIDKNGFKSQLDRSIFYFPNAFPDLIFCCNIGFAMGMQAFLVNLFHELMECHDVKIMVIAKVCAATLKYVRIREIVVVTGE